MHTYNNLPFFFLLFSVIERITAETFFKNKTALTHSDDVSLTERSAAAFKSNQVKLTIYWLINGKYDNKSE